MEILKYIEKEIGKIEKQKENKESRMEKIRKEIKKLENKVNTEIENENIIVKSEAKIKVLKNRIKVIELESIEELDKEFIKKAAETEIIKLNEDLEVKNKKMLEKIYNFLKEMAEYQESAKDKHLKLERLLRVNRIQGYFEGQFEQEGRIRNIYVSPEVKSDAQGVYLEKNKGFGIIHKFDIYKKDFQ